MKIKRFEASSMADALRMIKKEFGDEAVILSAKSVKKNGLLFGAKPNQVVVTAAVDTEVPKKAETGVAGPMNDHPQSEKTENSVKSLIWNRLEPITRTGREKLRAKFFRLSGEPESQKPSTETLPSDLRRRLSRAGVSSELTEEFVEKSEALLSQGNPDEIDIRTALCQVIGAKGIAAPRINNFGKRPRILLLVGPNGVGKTTTAVKLAAEAMMHGRRTALISIDRQRVSTATELERYAKIIGAEMSVAHDGQELAETLQRLSSVDLILIDTPGISPADREGSDYIVSMLQTLQYGEIHLLVNASMEGKAMRKIIACFERFSPHRLIFTHLDWTAAVGEIFNVAAQSGLSVSYLADSPQIPEGIHSATAQRLVALFWPEVSPPMAEQMVTVVPVRAAVKPEEKFVANVNSDIFHRNTCRSVKRIAGEHAVTFGDPDEAMGQGYKPCRMCCVDLFTPKPINRTASIFAAGNRYIAQ
jgi:flagellar biosynthesis protein FlhF